MESFKKSHPLIKIFYNSLINLPAPRNINYFWNFGSLLGLCLIIQIISGLLLASSYSPHKDLAFYSVMMMCLDSNFFWPIQMSHINGASLFFFCLFIHIGRGIYVQSYKLMETWNIGVTLLFLTMAAAFMGYVLPWGQMSFWGATVITGLLNTIPYIGDSAVMWLWGGFTPDNPTLNRFFMFHFIIPFIILMMMLMHLLFLHQTGSNSPMGFKSMMMKIPFYPYLIYKDIKGFLVIIFILIFIINFNPYMLGESDNFILANPIITPIHIVPEWYFLFAYAILRSIPSKLGGVIALIFSILILYFLTLVKSKFQSMQFYLFNKLLFWMMVFSIFLLTWIGMSPMELPFINLGRIFSITYFFFYLMNPLLFNFWNKLIN